MVKKLWVSFSYTEQCSEGKQARGSTNRTTDRREVATCSTARSKQELDQRELAAAQTLPPSTPSCAYLSLVYVPSFTPVTQNSYHILSLKEHRRFRLGSVIKNIPPDL